MTPHEIIRAELARHEGALLMEKARLAALRDDAVDVMNVFTSLHLLKASGCDVAAPLEWAAYLTWLTGRLRALADRCAAERELLVVREAVRRKEEDAAADR